jgi:formate dehydrogenase subunit gamma
MSTEPPTPAASAATVERHSGLVRLLHWSLAVAYVAAIATGFALYWQKLLGWLTKYFGGYDQTIYIHFWAGIILVLFTVLLGLAWRGVVRWSGADSEFVRRMPHHALHPSNVQPPETGFFNGGQKLYFWAVIFSGMIFLATGLVWSFRYNVPHNVYAVCRTTHRIMGMVMLAGLLVHIYKATLGERGTLRSMLGGRVTVEWARTRRPKWFRDIQKD